MSSRQQALTFDSMLQESQQQQLGAKMTGLNMKSPQKAVKVRPPPPPPPPAAPQLFCCTARLITTTMGPSGGQAKKFRQMECGSPASRLMSGACHFCEWSQAFFLDKSLATGQTLCTWDVLMVGDALLQQELRYASTASGSIEQARCDTRATEISQAWTPVL